MRLVNVDDCDKELFYKELGGKDSLITVETAFNMLQALPTAYDVDKVVEQLEERLPFCPTNQTDTRVEYELLEAIELVKGGGVDGN